MLRPTTVLLPLKGYEPWQLVRDLTTGHVLLQERWSLLGADLKGAGFNMLVNEVYRWNVRQQWLYGAGRTAQQLKAKGINEKYARPKELSVTNAASSLTSAHGWVEQNAAGVLVPAAAALDVVPLGADGKPWTKDDPWDRFLTVMRDSGYAHGLVHFTKPGKPPWDRPHLQLKEWSDTTKRVEL